jgi:hypothetical protein
VRDPEHVAPPSHSGRHLLHEQRLPCAAGAVQQEALGRGEEAGGASAASSSSSRRRRRSRSKSRSSSSSSRRRRSRRRRFVLAPWPPGHSQPEVEEGPQLLHLGGIPPEVGWCCLLSRTVGGSRGRLLRSRGGQGGVCGAQEPEGGQRGQFECCPCCREGECNRVVGSLSAQELFRALAHVHILGIQ